MGDMKEQKITTAACAFYTIYLLKLLLFKEQAQRFDCYSGFVRRRRLNAKGFLLLICGGFKKSRLWNLFRDIVSQRPLFERQ